MLKASIKKKLAYFELDADFQVSNSQILVLWGPSGAGKSTILECLAGLRTPDTGIIELGDTILYSSHSSTIVPARERRVGYLFQDYALFPHMTVEKNVLYGLRSFKPSNENEKKRGLDYRVLLDAFGLSHLINRFPSQLSGGEQQRVALVRALVIQPHLLLLDEPFSALDRQSKQKLRQEILNLQKEWQIPMVVVTHDEEDANALGDIIISLHQGQVIEKHMADSHKSKLLGSYKKSVRPSSKFTVV
jgi:molybdate transport system ATP-binding protein